MLTSKNLRAVPSLASGAMEMNFAMSSREGSIAENTERSRIRGEIPNGGSPDRKVQGYDLVTTLVR